MKNNRGSVVLASMIVATIVAVLCGSYILLVTSELKLSSRAFQFNAATNLAEAGVEEALWALNHKTVNAGGGWAISGSDATYIFHSGAGALNLGTVYKGELRVRIDGFASSTPTIISDGRVLYSQGSPLQKQVKVKVISSAGTVPGMTILNNIIFNQKAAVDSYNSASGFHNASTNRRDQVSVLSMQGSIQTNDAQIWGQVGVGGSSTSVVGAPMNGGYLRNSATTGNTTYDTKLITTGVKMYWPTTPVPPTIGSTGGSVLHLTANAVNTLGTAGSTTPQYYYYTDNGGTMNLDNSTSIKVDGPVVLVVQRGMNLSGTAKISFSPNASAKLSIYVSENVNTSGTLVLNDQPEASRLTIYGCGGQGQNIALNGTVTFTGVFYGPYWNVNVNNGVDWSGGMLAQYANLSSSSGFHYDEALGGSSTTIKISSWQALRDAATAGTTYARDTRDPFNR